MKTFSLFCLISLAGFGAVGAESFTQRLCYSGCTFDGLEKARRACNMVAGDINQLSNEKVQLVASCRPDREGTYCELSPFCTFPNIVLETKFIVH